MNQEAATLLTVALGLIFVVFLLFPLVYFLRRLPSIWSADSGAGLLVTVIFGLTGVSFLLYLIALVFIVL